MFYDDIDDPMGCTFLIFVDLCWLWGRPCKAIVSRYRLPLREPLRAPGHGMPFGIHEKLWEVDKGTELPFGKTRYSFPFVAAAHVKSAYSANATVTCHAVKCSGMHVQIYAITFLWDSWPYQKGLSTKIRRLGEVQENFGLRLNYWRHCNMHPGLTRSY